MQMQEPEQQQSWQAAEPEEYEGYHAEYPGTSDQQQAYAEGLAANDYQAQKIYPQPEQRQRGKMFAILGIVFSSIGFFLMLTGIILSSLVLHFADGRHIWLVGGTIGLIVSILLMLVCIAIFVLSIVWLALRTTRTQLRKRYQGL